ncbi:pyroglutamyl-peptidase I [Cytobacillus kochii]|uniref:pyroglutamyl-peptidase I n=1 Tax=Cytobacillus kochii TaxID=859143 RepID=UPI00402AF428
MQKLLLTGFEPFLDFPINPTAEVVEALDGKNIGNYHVQTALLPVSFKHVKQTLITKMEEMNPDAVILMGLAAGRDKITPERIAINVNDGPVDNNGVQPVDETIHMDGEDGYFSTLPIRQMVERLHHHGFPAKISNTAGAYLCNHVMYQVLYYIKKHNINIPAGFIHIPASHRLALTNSKLPSWSQYDLTRAIEICIETLE